MELRCRPIACVIFFVLVLVCARGIKGNDLSPSSQVTAASPSMGMRASGPVSHENLPRTSTPSSAPTSNEGDLPPKVSPPKPVSMGPTIQNISPSVLPSYPPGQLPSEQGSRASSPSVESHWSIAPAVAGDVSPSRSISSPPLPQTTKGDTNGTSPSVSSTPVEIPPKPPVANRSIIAPPPSSIGASNIKDFPTPALPPVFSVSPVNHGERNHVPAAAPHTGTSSDISPVHHSPLGGFVPVSSPKSQESLISPGVAPASIISHSPPNDQPPASVPTHSNNQGSNSRNSSSSPSSDQVISPLPSLPPKAVPRNHSSHHVPPPIARGPSSMQSPVPSVTAKTPPVPLPPHATPSSQRHGPIVSPLPSVDIPFQEGAPAPSPFGSLPVAPPRRNHGAIHSPVVSPSGSLVLGSGNPSPPPAQVLPPSPMSVPRPKQALPPSPAPVAQPKRAPVVSPSGSLALGSGNPSLPPAQVLPPSPMSVPRPQQALPPSPAPVARPKRALPPPPANLDCTTLSCTDPWTNSPPGSICACVRPMKVELRLGVALYTFFPLVSELAQQIASGTFMNQSQVRIMGANAATEQPEKTLVLVDLVPLGKFFDRTTALLTAEKFWHKQVGIKVSDFGDYDVLYVTYPGLPPSPPMPPGNNVNVGAFGKENNSRRIHPLGVDIRKRREKLGGSLIAIIVLSSVIALVLLVGAAWFLFLKPSNGASLSRQVPQNSLPLISKASGTGPTVLGSRPSSASGSFTSSIATYTGSARTFTVAEIEKATNKFEDSNIIGEGGFGRVYQGILEDGTKMAVKVLKRDDQQGSREFLAEVEMLGRLHHRNLVKLIGICTEEHLRSLIYELIPNGSVDSHLHGSDKEIAPLDWGARVKIALGSARGLAYLHEDSSPRVIHRDFKSSNILLECDFTPKVSDFGLARTALDKGNGHISTRVMGTFGYVAPEYAMTGHLLVKSDVYSYGVVLLELLTGRKPVDMLRPPGQENLVTWARPLLTSKEGLETITDPALGSNVPFDSVAKVAAIASMCVQPEVSHRPFMGEVVQALKLICNESDEHRVSGGCSQGDPTDQDPELRICTSLVPGADRVLSTSEIFSTSATLTRDASSSFRRHSSSGPLRTNRTGQFWIRLRGLSKGSMSEHAFALGSRTSGERWP